jgi:hypothetical protein
MTNDLADCQYRHDWVDGKCNTCGVVDSIKRIAALETKLRNIDDLADQLYHALELTKSDAEKNGFEYGAQSNCMKAITACLKHKKILTMDKQKASDHVIEPQELAEIANKIADRLFTNGMNQQAQRLVLELPGKRDGGGWCKQAVVDQIVEVLCPEASHDSGNC